VQVLGRNSLTRRAALVAASAFVIAGCSAVGGSKGPPPTYDLTAPTGFPPAGRAARGQLVIPEATTLSALDSDKIVVRPADGAIAALTDAQWSDRLPKLVQTRVIQAFENAARLRAVGRPGDRIAADYQLLLDIRAFEIAVGSGPAAEVEISAKIVGDSSGRIMATRVFRATVPGPTQGPEAMAALDQAFGRVVTDMVLWATRAI
jgi:cholesterol transport system auxiliary component